MTRITDPYLAEYSKEALGECGFKWYEGAWTKLNFTGSLSSAELLDRVLTIRPDNLPVKAHAEVIATDVQTATKEGNSELLLRLEKNLWPLKILDLSIPTFIVPIRPEWAMHLFDSEISSQNLFGGNPHLIFRVENAYYRSKTPRILGAPGRILWYVSKHSGKYQGTEAIRACSYLEEVVIDDPKALFSRYRRLGVYRWTDIQRLATGKADSRVMGFRFSKTEVLAHPIQKATLQKIWQKEFGKNFHIQAPIEIPSNKFFDLYSLSI